MSLTPEREAFEKWRGVCPRSAYDTEKYALRSDEDAWRAWQAAYALGLAAGLEEAAGVCEKRAELRFEAHGYTEPDINASYYIGEYKDLGDSLDEEDADCAAAIRARMK
jgi:hypothetical protein